MTTWNDLITEKLEENGETWEDVEHCTFDTAQLNANIYDCEVEAFNVFTSSWVYFAHDYDFHLSCECVPRHPYIAEPTVIGE